MGVSITIETSCSFQVDILQQATPPGQVSQVCVGEGLAVLDIQLLQLRGGVGQGEDDVRYVITRGYAGT